MSQPKAPSSFFRFEQLVPFAILSLAVVIGWVYLGYMVVDMMGSMDMGAMGPGMEVFNQSTIFEGLSAPVRAQLAALCVPMAAATFGMPELSSYNFQDFLWIFLMWIMMVLAMMLPSAAPMLSRFSAVRKGNSVLVVALGYLAVWTLFSAIASGLQLAMHAAGSLTTMMVPAFQGLTVSIILAAGLYQFTPFKLACLDRCRNPKVEKAGLAAERGVSPFRFGVEEGLNCLGCCWALMTLMFAVGIMNILWIALLGLVMALEKTTRSNWFTYGIGIALLLWGMANLYFMLGSLPIMDALSALFVAR
ncbi:DUF2182 domain-containing protein [Rhodobacteraceae bacterium RKSG542]|uniref:DUF2182 domain-containing protein n=1 Tax=Pseudovibrio flavus TaxID=2529854 RepID=UPI0012BD7516|nr:DUF2182 domain-containing protein [Pseudovibrio flavus]MTI17546.1 DUF2182 domain-containing protein [Pseudovibrio flavus]